MIHNEPGVELRPQRLTPARLVLNAPPLPISHASISILLTEVDLNLLHARRRKLHRPPAIRKTVGVITRVPPAMRKNPVGSRHHVPRPVSTLTELCIADVTRRIRGHSDQHELWNLEAK